MTSRQKLFQILQFRNEEVIAQTSESIKQTNADIHHSTLVTNRLATASNEKNETIARLTEEARRDSKSLKILTFVAMLYLPATLMAVRRFPSLLNLPNFGTFWIKTKVERWRYVVQTIFSSNLVGFSANNEEDQSHATRFAVAPQFWIYPVLTIPLMVVTIMPAVIWDRRSGKARCVPVT